MARRYGHVNSIIFSLCCYLFLRTVYTKLPQDQKNIMVSLYNMIQNNTGTAFAWNGTNRGSDPCSWKGVSCSPNNTSIKTISLRTFFISNDETLPLLCGIKSLESLDLSDNQLSSIPGGFITGCGGISGLKVLNFSSNSLKGHLPSFTGFGALELLDLSLNSLSGNIDLQLDRLSSLKYVDLSLNSLNLSHNLFSGPIPTTLTRLIPLKVLDLSNNRFSGQIPASMAGMSGLRHLLLANNQLSGVVPAFPEYVELDLKGNHLIFPPPPSPHKSHAKKELSVAVVIVIAVAVTAVGSGLFTFIALSVLRNMYKVRGYWLTDHHHHIHHKSQLDFCKAMAVMGKPSNIILKTEWYTYYRAAMPCGTNYCIKKINWSNKAFTLHNPAKFVEELIRLARLFNRDIMAPLAYVLTSRSAFIFYEFPEFGSLFRLLHEDKYNVLDWKCRFSIILGISRGLNFLHGNGSENAPRIHLNLSTTSIMMKSLYEPIIGDFELSSVIRPSHDRRTPSVVAGAVGFVPPEYAYTMRVTTSGNIYSFGVIMLELLTGKPAVYEGIELATWVTSRSGRPGNLEEILDSRVGRISAEVQHQMLALLRIALRCINTSPSERPDAEALLEMLLDLGKYVGI